MAYNMVYFFYAARWERNNLRNMICFKHVVRSVCFDPRFNKFHVAVKDLAQDVLKPPQEFDYLINCSGHFSVPHIPDFPGFGTFPGHILHAHDFRDAGEFKGNYFSRNFE